ncbi:MAG: universal stress protein [Flavobacteriales bacterium]|nr:universal stress protein [Flavobacteriales bacterium]
MTFKKILIPTDYSEVSETAMDYACELSLKFGAELYLITIQSLPASDDANMAVELIKTIQESNELKLKELSHRCEEKFPGLKISIHFSFGITSITLNDYVKTGKFDLVVIGSQSNDGLEGFLFNSTAESISKEAPCPVLIVPRRFKFRSISKIMVPLDVQMNFKNSVHVIQKIVDFAALFDAEMEWFYVETKENETTTSNFPTILQNECEVKINIMHAENVEAGILQYREKYKPDMVVFIKQDYGIIKKLFHHSILHEHLGHQQLPVMTIHC